DDFGDRGKNIIIDLSLVFENLSVCDYAGVYCTSALDNKRNKIVTNIDLNDGDITEYLPEELGNNWFTSKFPEVSVMLHLLKFLDLRFNEFEETVPKELFDKDLDAIFINHNRYRFNLPDNFGKSTVSIIVLANNKFHGCVLASVWKMTGLEENILMNNRF
ncbi:hypothetical protein Goshw_029014, partial [Gossypium schwendimanii]|nr:hypothetical protein [Gossypium schwendimanii]